LLRTARRHGDLFVGHAVLHHIPDSRAVELEVVRVLKLAGARGGSCFAGESDHRPATPLPRARSQTLTWNRHDPSMKLRD